MGGLSLKSKEVALKCEREDVAPALGERLIEANGSRYHLVGEPLGIPLNKNLLSVMKTLNNRTGAVMIATKKIDICFLHNKRDHPQA